MTIKQWESAKAAQEAAEAASLGVAVDELRVSRRVADLLAPRDSAFDAINVATYQYLLDNSNRIVGAVFQPSPLASKR